jgi:hypothetical protein
MRDRGVFWTPSPDWSTARIERKGWSAEPVFGLGQTLVSGDVEAALDELAPGGAEVGLWEITDTDRVLVRIARDRALLVTPRPVDLAPGWRQAGYAVTPCDDAYAVLALKGSGTADLLATAAAADIEAGSRSASLLVAGVPALLYRVAPDVARIHVEAPLAAYVWTWLEETAAFLPP